MSGCYVSARGIPLGMVAVKRQMTGKPIHQSRGIESYRLIEVTGKPEMDVSKCYFLFFYELAKHDDSDLGVLLRTYGRGIVPDILPVKVV